MRNRQLQKPPSSREVDANTVSRRREFLFQPFGFFKTQHQIHTLDCRAGRALAQIIKQGDQHHLVALFDNLGKGSSGAAIQCMNLMLGLEETKGLE